jgi:mannose 2-epimerase
MEYRDEEYKHGHFAIQGHNPGMKIEAKKVIFQEPGASRLLILQNQMNEHMDKKELAQYKIEAENHLVNELLPFWTSRMMDLKNGGYLTHFDEKGNDTGEDEKSLIAQTRCLYTLSSAHRAGYGNGKLADMARHGVDFLLEKMWDKEHGGFFWMLDRKGNVKIDQKIIYGHSFAIYSLSEYTLATGDRRGVEYAGKGF